MIIPSIDISRGRTVQLVGGESQALEAGDPIPWLERFRIAGEVAVVDIDAARGDGSNEAQIASLCAQAPCRVGGGIRDYETAVRWLDAGAAKIVIGTAAQPDLLRRLPKDRLIAALDARDGDVVTHGWRTSTGRSIDERIAELRDLVGGFLVTFVELEGRLGGTDLARAQRLVAAAGDARLTIAGGVTTAEEVAALDHLGADAQVGMALYTGRLTLGAAVAAPLSSDRSDGLIPTVVVDDRGTALGLAWSSTESLAQAVEERRGVYQSRTRGRWVKGETSGATQELVRVNIDCDRDALRFTVRQAGAGFCHTGTRSCWGTGRDLGSLSRELASRIGESANSGSYTARLAANPLLLQAKLVEEAAELADARGAEETIHEAADLMYFTLATLAARGVALADVESELVRRGAAHYAPRWRRETGSWGGLPMNARLLPNLSLSAALSAAPAVDAGANESVRAAARAIVDDVRTNGIMALQAYASRFDGWQPGAPWLIERSEMRRALDALDRPTRALLERTAGRIGDFARAQRAALTDIAIPVAGGQAGHTVVPMARAGCYAPAGRHPLPSSLLMTAVTARAAGVEEVVVASPRPASVMLAAAAIADVDALLAVGGAHAIAALAYGVGVPACDIVVGPGNRWVTEAKRIVSGDVAIDMLAGPSELLVVADASADVAEVVADLIAQAEHDTDAYVALVTTDAVLVDAVRAELELQLATLPTSETARTSLERGAAVLCANDSEIAAVCDALAPEHLQLSVRNPDALAARLKNAGALFVGSRAAQVFGDYGIGGNHVLPTGRGARFTGGLSALTFLRVRSWLALDDPTIAATDSAGFARLEGLEGHARAAEQRLRRR